MSKNRPIGLYDSGVGGLTVVREVFAQMPSERVLYFGDTLRVPYGSRSASELLQFNREILHFMVNQGVKLVLVACNTSCAVALPALRAEFSVPIMGIIDAGAQAAVGTGRRIGVIATEATIKSGAYDRAIKSLSPEATVLGQACPTLVPLVESGRWDGPEALEIIRDALLPLMGEKLDTLSLGCTHVPLLA
ncbi:MAG: glutamate racemase, partial [Bacteroidota bacterium]